MPENIVKDGKFNYAIAGEGSTILVLHGLMGGLSNFRGMYNHFSENGYQVVIPELPI